MAFSDHDIANGFRDESRADRVLQLSDLLEQNSERNLDKPPVHGIGFTVRCPAKQAEWRRSWRERNRAHVRAYRRRWAAANKDRIRVYTRRWRAARKP